MDSVESSQNEHQPLLRVDSDVPPPPLSTSYKVIRIIVLIGLWICFGAFSEITGVVLPELIVQTHSSYETIAQSLSMRGAGHALGGIIGGLTVDRWFHHIDILTAVILCCYTAISVSAAYAQNIVLLFLIYFTQGSMETWLQTAGFRIALITWKEKSAGPLHALHTGYGLGSLIAPQLVAPFLDSHFSGGSMYTSYNSTCNNNDTITMIDIASTTTTDTLLNITHSGAVTPKYPANFVVGYWVLSVMSLCIAAIFLIYYIYGRVTDVRIDRQRESKKVTQPTFKESLSAKNCSPIHPTHAAMIIASLFFYYVISVPLIRAFSKFIFSYARDGPCLSIGESTSLESAYFAAVTAGRLCAFLTSSVLHMKYILQVEVIGVLVSALVLFFSHNNISILWVFCSVLGFFTGPIIPSAFAWANRYIEVTSTAQIIPQIGAAIGDVAFLMGVGYSYQHYGPFIIWSYQLVLGSAICVVAWFMQIIGSLHGDRYTSTQ